MADVVLTASAHSVTTLEACSHPTRPGYVSRRYGAICCGCYGRLWEWSPEPGEPILTADGSVLGWPTAKPGPCCAIGHRAGSVR